VKYDAAARELQAVEQDLARCTAELNTFSLCEEHYRLCLEEKAAAIKASGSPDGFEILGLETSLQTLECQLTGLHEAADAGHTALFTAKNVQTTLDHAQEMGTWDLFGGDVLGEEYGHDHLDDAQALVEQLQVELSRFRTELIDVRLEDDILISLEGFSRFSDLFFDGLFADWAVLDRIGQARSQIRQTVSEIEGVLEKLDSLVRMTRMDMEQHRAALDTFIVKT